MLNIRSGPGTSYTKMGRFAKGDSVDIITAHYTDDWHQIWYGGQTAYVYADYVTLSGAAPDITQTGTVWVNVLNIRSGPGTSYTKMGRFARGDSVDIITAHYTDDWHKIWYDGQIAYVYADYVTLSSAEPEITQTGVITASVLNIRNGPGTSYDKLGAFKKGDQVDIIKANYTEDWHKILYNGSVAYVHADYVGIGGASAQDDRRVCKRRCEQAQFQNVAEPERLCYRHA